MRREELYLADLIDNARAVRGYLDGVTRERWDAEDITTQKWNHSCASLPRVWTGSP
jgi:uncharacterized protein with HEPN domain